MSQRPKSSQSVALFPFLAVLVCTMGSLIFLLLVTTRMISDRASAVAEAALSPPQMPVASVALPDDPPSQPAPPIQVDEEPEEPEEPIVDVRAIARHQREQELDALVSQWQRRLNDLTSVRDERSRLLDQRKQLFRVAAQRVSALQKELEELEIQLGRLTGELSASAVGDGTVKERIQLETQIRDLKQRLRAAQQAQSSDDKFEVVPFDPISGTSRRPIFIECTAGGLRFIPEDILITRNDLTGFTPRVNPILVGASALVNYWTAWAIRQPNPAREPEPYVLLLVRPSGTYAYYVAMTMLTDLKQPHGYELIDEDTDLQVPPVDAGAKAACEAAIKRLLSERDQVLRQVGAAGFGVGRGGVPGGPRTIQMSGSSGPAAGAPNGAPSGGSGNGSSGNGGGGKGSAASGGSPGAEPSSAAGGTESGSGQFDLADIMSNDQIGNRSWERVENFEGTKRPTGGIPAGNMSARGTMNRGGQGGGAGTATPKAVAAAGGKEPKGVSFSASKPGSVPVLEGADKSGIETLEDSPEEEDGPGNIKRNKPAADQEAVDVGLGSTGSSTIAVEDRRTRKKKSSERDAPSQPEDLVHHHWGYSEPGAAIGLERDVRMDVEARRFVIARKHAVKVEDTDSPEDTFAKIVTVLDLQARDWGKPAQGFYWKPSLRYVIADGGQENYERVKSLLERAGISSTIEQGHDHGAVAEKPKPSSSTHSPAPATNPPKTSRRFFRGILK